MVLRKSLSFLLKMNVMYVRVLDPSQDISRKYVASVAARDR